jgi:ferrochelatase
MRYWHPFTSEAIQQLQEADCDEVVLLPLYPHYSSTTTGSSLNEWKRHFRSGIPVCRIDSFYRDKMYLDSLIEKIDQALSRFSAPDRPEIVFSAHSLPQSIIDGGDPYQKQIEETVELLMRRGAWANHHCVCYQSKVGASKWLQPSLRRTLRDLAGRKVEDVCIVPISFVSDHVETLGEIDHEARELAHEIGIRQFEMTAGLNDSPKFIEALARLVLRTLGETSTKTIPLQESASASLMAAD